MKRIVLVSLVFIVLMLIGCAKNVEYYKQAQKQFNFGEFERAFQTAAQSVQLKPSYVKVHPLIKESYDKAISQREEKIAKLENSTEAAKWDSIVLEYQALDSIQALAKKLPTMRDEKTGFTTDLATKDYSEAWMSARTNAAEYHYQKGMTVQKSGMDPETQKKAAKEFKTAQSYIPDYKDTALRYDQSRKAGVKRIAIIPFDDKTGTNGRYGALQEILIDNIVGAIMSDPSCTEFLEIITRDQINAVLAEQKLATTGIIDERTASQVGSILGAHELMTGSILQIIPVPARVQKMDYKETARVVIGQEEYYDDKGKKKTKDVWGDVSCNYTKFTKEANAKITGSYAIVEVSTGKVKLKESFTAENPWQGVWGKVGNGDQRALSSVIKNLVATPEPFEPTELELVNEAINKLSIQFISQIKSYVK